MLDREERAFEALRAGHPVAHDRIARSLEPWPAFFELCLRVAHLGREGDSAMLFERLKCPEPKAAAAGPRMIRAVDIAKRRRRDLEPAALQVASDVAAMQLSEALLAEAFDEGRPLPGRLQACEKVTLPILLARLAERPAERGVVADLTLWALPTPDDEARLRFHVAPPSYLLDTDPEFDAGLRRAATSVAGALAGPTADAPAFVWDLHPRDAAGEPYTTLGIVGESASAAFAIAALYLMRSALPPAWRAAMNLIDWRGIAVTAGIAPQSQQLTAVRNIAAKLGALARQSPAYGPSPVVFVAETQTLGGYAAPPRRCKTLEALVMAAAEATGGQLDENQRALHEALLDGGPVAADQELLGAVASLAPRSLRAYLLSRYAHWALADQGRLHQRFVELRLTDLTAQAQRDHSVGSPTFGSLAALLDGTPQAQAFLLVGEPGSGKSTLLQHHEMLMARRALQRLNAGDRVLEFCLWVPLADLPESSDGPLELSVWLAERWRSAHPQMPELIELLRSHRVRLLLDGLNEMGVTNAARWRANVGRLARSLRGPKLAPVAPVFSVRLRDNTALLGGLVVHQVELAPWSRQQMRRYCARRLGGSARALWRCISKEPDLMQIAQLPLNLAAQCELHAAGLSPAANRAELLSAVVWSRMRREFTAGRLETPGLLGDADRQALQHPSLWAKRLLSLPAEGCLVSSLDRQADLLRRLHRVQIDLEQTASWIEPAALRTAWLRAVEGLGLAGAALGTSRWAFTHQLLGEYFQARGFLCGDPAEAAESLAPPPLEPLGTVLRRLQADEMLPGPGAAALEECFKLAVQLSPDADWWIAAAVPANLALAARAGALCADRLSAALKAGLKEALLLHSRDARIDLRLRIEAATALGALGDDLRYVTESGCEGHSYRTARDAHWFTVSGGEYDLSGEIADESPRTTVTLSAFQIAFAPVTVAEYECFVACGGYEDKRWWLGDTAQRWHRGELPNNAGLAYWQPIFAALRADFSVAVQTYFPNETRGYIDGELREYASWSEDRAQAELQRRFGARKVRRPGLTRHPLYNQPLLPITGISLFEAEAYCRWLSWQSGREVRLPTEAEWEAAARGRTGRTWPWGNDAPSDASHLNADPAHLRRNSPVGVFPLADTPQGLTDMAGNVEQLTSSAYGATRDAMNLVTPLADGEGLRTSRGGSWSEVVGLCRATTRFAQHPAHRTLRLGFRLVRS